MESAIANEPLSTESQEFSKFWRSSLANDGFFVALIRWANCGGAKDYFRVRTAQDMRKVLVMLRPMASISVVGASSFPVRGEVNAGLLDAASELLATPVVDEDETQYFLDAILEAPELEISHHNLAYIASAGGLESWVKNNQGRQAILGHMTWWAANSASIVTAYCPSEDGMLQLGAY